jgi:hypothetical protein
MEDFYRDQFLGPQLGTYYGYPVYAPDKDAFYQATTPEQFRSFSGNLHNVSETWTQNVSFQLVNANLFEMPAGSVGMAAVIQVGNQFWDNPVDPRITNNEFFALNGTSGRGKRNNQALGVEFTVPLLKELTADVAVRYDAYQNVDAGSTPSRPTRSAWNSVRASNCCSGPTTRPRSGRRTWDTSSPAATAFFSNETDFYKCEIDPTNCALYTGVSVEGNQVANPDLKSINANSYGFGFVWSPSSDLDLRADYYNVSITDEVVPQSTTQTLFDENECRQGRLDPTSARCIDAISRVVRGPVNPTNPLLSENVQLIIVKGINIAEESVSGITAGGNYHWDAGAAGRFAFGLEYNLTLDHKFKTFPDSPATDVFTNGQLLTAEFKSIVTGDIGWELGRWSANLHGTRYGSLPNYARQFTTDPADPYITSNGVGPGHGRAVDALQPERGLRHHRQQHAQPDREQPAQLAPPKDPSYDGSQGFAPPYYNIFAYNGYGRSYWLEYRIDFGGGS